MAPRKPRAGDPVYNAEFHPRLAELYARMGMTNKQMALQLGIGERTLIRWLAEKPELAAAVKKGKDSPDDLVESALFRRAVGFKYKAQKPLTVFLGKGEGSEVRIVEYDERVLPDVTACIYWLKCRRPEKWRQDNPALNMSETLAVLDKVLAGVKGELLS